MFGFGILTYIKVGAVAVALLVLGFFVWNYHHRGVVIERQKIEIANLHIEAEVAQKAAEAAQAYNDAKNTVLPRAAHEKQGIETMVESGNLPGVVDLYRKYGVQYPPGFLAPDGKPGSPGHRVAPPASPGTVH